MTCHRKTSANAEEEEQKEEEWWVFGSAWIKVDISLV